MVGGVMLHIIAGGVCKEIFLVDLEKYHRSTMLVSVYKRKCLVPLEFVQK